MKRRSIALSLSLLLSACGSSRTIIEPDKVQITSVSRAAAQGLVPGADRNPAMVEHLAHARQIYNMQMTLLQERRNKVRARKRDLNFASYGILGTTSLAVGGVAIGAAAADTGQQGALIGAGVTALVGLGLGTLLQVTSLMQEEPTEVDRKREGLKMAYEQMLDRVRALSVRAPGPGETDGTLHAQITALIDGFISTALQVNVKG